MSEHRDFHIGPLYPSWQHDWDSLLPGCNWRDFTFINLYVDWAHNTGRFEVHAALFGLHVGFQWVYNENTVNSRFDVQKGC